MLPQGFSGNYKLRLRRIWGQVATGKVTVDIYTHYGTPQQTHIRQQIPVGERDAVVNFAVADGRRTEPLEQAQLAQAVADQTSINRAVLAQQLSALNTASASATDVSSAGSWRRRHREPIFPVRAAWGGRIHGEAHHFAGRYAIAGVRRRFGRPPLCADQRPAELHHDSSSRYVQYGHRIGRRRRQQHRRFLIRSFTICGGYRTNPGCTSSVSGSISPAFNRSSAIAPITALSVQRFRGAMCRRMPRSWHAAANRSRNSLFAATPPPTANVFSPVCSNAKSDLSIKQSITAR